MGREPVSALCIKSNTDKTPDIRGMTCVGLGERNVAMPG